jgi:hypothetical protein
MRTVIADRRSARDLAVIRFNNIKKIPLAIVIITQLATGSECRTLAWELPTVGLVRMLLFAQAV